MNITSSFLDLVRVERQMNESLYMHATGLDEADIFIYSCSATSLDLGPTERYFPG